MLWLLGASARGFSALLGIARRNWLLGSPRQGPLLLRPFDFEGYLVSIGNLQALLHYFWTRPRARDESIHARTFVDTSIHSYTDVRPLVLHASAHSYVKRALGHTHVRHHVHLHSSPDVRSPRSLHFTLSEVCPAHTFDADASSLTPHSFLACKRRRIVKRSWWPSTKRRNTFFWLRTWVILCFFLRYIGCRLNTVDCCQCFGPDIDRFSPRKRRNQVTPNQTINRNTRPWMASNLFSWAGMSEMIKSLGIHCHDKKRLLVFKLHVSW